MEQKPIESDFSLTKIKLTKDGGAAVTYKLNSNKVHVECDEYIHADLHKCFSELRPLMAHVFALPEILQENIFVNGIGIAGKDENKGCVLIADYTTISGQPTKIASPRIKFLESYYGFEMQLQDIVNAIEHEVFEYLFNGKKSELEYF